MADLKTEYAEIQIDGGVDTYTAAEKVELPKHLAHEDGSLAEPGACNLRRSYSAYSKDMLLTDLGITIEAVAGVRGLITDGDALISVTDALANGNGVATVWDGSRWVISDYAGYFPVTSARSLVDMADVQHTQAARANGHVCVYARTSTASAQNHRFVIYRESDESIVRAGYFFIDPDGSPTAANGCQPKLVAMGGRYFLLIYVDGADIRCRKYDTQADQTDWVASTIATFFVHDDHKNIDAWADNSRLFIAFNSPLGAAVLRVTMPSGTVTAGPSAIITADLGDAGLSIAGPDDASHQYVILSVLDSATGSMTIYSLDEDDLGLVHSLAFESSLANVLEIAMLTYGNTVGLAYTIRTSTGIDSCITRFRRWNPATGAAGAASLVTYGGWILSKKPIRIRGQDIWGFQVINTNDESTEYLVVDYRAVSLGNDGPRTGGDWGLAICAQLNPLGSVRRAHNQYNIAGRIVPADASGDVFFTSGYESITHGLGDGDTGSKIRLFTLDGRPHIANRAFVFDRMLFVGGSYPRRWSRESLQLGFTESVRGFQAIVPPHAPQPVSGTASTGAGSLTLLGTYSYKWTVEYVGQDGRRAQSAPSEAVEKTLTGTQNTITLALGVAGLSIPQWAEPSMMRGNPRSYQMVFWRTIANPTDVIYYRVGAVDMGSTSFVDFLADGAINTNEVLYTVSSELENRQAPPSLAMFPWKDRIVCLHAETGELWPSKSWDASEVGGWNISLAVQTNVWVRPPVFASALDDKIVVWWSDAIGAVFGEPPNDLGQGGTLAPPILIKKGVGLRDVASVVDTPEAILFRAANGIYALGRDLSVTFVGRTATGLLPDSECVGAHYLEAEEEARFVFADRIVVYQMARQEWHTHLIGVEGGESPNRPTITASTVLDGDLHLCWPQEFGTAPDVGFIWREDSEASGDPDGERPLLRQSTGWIKVGGTSGPQRIQRLWLIGVLDTSTELDLFYDYSSTPEQTKSFATVGSGSLTTYEVHVPREDCHAFRFELRGHTRLVSARVALQGDKGTYQRTVVRI